MQRFFARGFAVVIGLALVVPSVARADKPDYGYLQTGVAIPWHYAAEASRPDPFEGPWNTRCGLGRRPRLMGLDALSFGAGIGYDGLNLQVDVRSLGEATRAYLTVGVRFKVRLSRFELWARLAAGPQYTFSLSSFSAERDNNVGITAVGEVGADLFLVDEWLALGLKAGGAPDYEFPASFGVELGLSVGLRLLL